MIDDKALSFILRAYEEKLHELMEEDEYKMFIKQTAREAFREELKDMKDGKAKDFIMLFFDEMTQ